MDQHFNNICNIITDKKINMSNTDIHDILCLCSDLTLDYDESHNVQHHVDVLQNAVIIFAKLDSQKKNLIPVEEKSNLLQMIIYASLLHDTIDHKYQNNLENKKIKLNSFLMRKLLAKWINVKWIIDNISYSKEVKGGYPIHENQWVSLARDIVSDADKLEAIGTKGIDRCKQFSIASNPGRNNNEILKLVVDHCYDKLLKLKDNYIVTIPGKQMAELPHQIIVDFVESYK